MEHTSSWFSSYNHQNHDSSPCPSQRSHERVSIRMTLMKTPPQRLHPHTKPQQWTLVHLQLPPYLQPPTTQLHQEPQLRWFLHQTLPFVSFNLLILHELPMNHHTVPGRTWTIKSWSISRMTPTLVLHGKQLVGYVVILKYAKCDGRSLNKRLTNTVKSRLLTSPRQKTKRLYNTTKGKKECLPLYCQACMLGVSFTALGFVLLSANFSVAIYFPLVLVIMAYSSDYVRMVPDRSRSRDDPMWHHRSYSRQSNSQYRDVWREVPPVRQPRRVLIIVDLEPVRPPVTAVHGDTMESTTCCSLPSLGRMEEYALFTYNVLVHPYHTETLTVNILLYYISQHITYTWDRYLEPTSMDLRWQDSTGDTFVLRNEQTLIDLLREHRPHWTEGQDFGILLPNEIRASTSPNQPYIMRLSCHAALPNPNMLP